MPPRVGGGRTPRPTVPRPPPKGALAWRWTGWAGWCLERKKSRTGLGRPFREIHPRLARRPQLLALQRSQPLRPVRQGLCGSRRGKLSMMRQRWDIADPSCPKRSSRWLRRRMPAPAVKLWIGYKSGGRLNLPPNPALPSQQFGRRTAVPAGMMLAWMDPAWRSNPVRFPNS